MTNPNAGAVEAAKTPAKAWLMLAVVFLYSVTTAMLWFSVPPMAEAIIPHYIIQLGPENIQNNFGALMSYIAITSCITALIASPIQNKIGVKGTMLIGTAFIVAGALTAALSGDNYNILVASRFLAGVAVGLSAVSGTTAVSLWFGPDRRGLAIAIWATWVPVAMLIVYNLIAPYAIANNIHFVWWCIGIIAAIAFVLALVVYRNPARQSSQAGQISTEKTSLTAGFKFLADRRVVALLLCMLFYTFVSNCFVTYNVTFFTSELGMDTQFANLIASIASACGILAPLFGALSDKLHPNRKYLMIVAGGVAYVIACILGFKDLGTPLFFAYIVAMILANAIMVATIRPTMPMLVGKGGVTAVTVGMAAVAFMANFGQIFTNFYGVAIDNLGWAQSSWVVAVPIAAMLLISAVLVKPGKADLLPENKEKVVPAVEASAS